MALPLGKVTAYKGSPYLRIDPALQVESLLINVTRPPLDRLEVRQALAQAIRRTPLCEQVLRAGQEPALNFVPPQTAGGFKPIVKIVEGNPDAKVWENIGELAYAYNTSDARKLVAETLQSQLNAAADKPILRLENLEWKNLPRQTAGQRFRHHAAGLERGPRRPVELFGFICERQPE
jgi:oligopeptide transport system substrate-binding protein